MVLHANTFFQIISLFYIALIGTVFLIKKKVESAENYIFRNLVIVGFLSAILDIVSILLGFDNPEGLMALFTAKGYLLTLIGFCIIYTEYAIIITNHNTNNEEKLEQYKKLRMYIWGIFALIAVAVLIAPIYIYTKDNEIMYSLGPAVTVTYAICGFCIMLWIALLIVRVKYLAPRKTFPIVGVIVIGGLAVLIQLFNPQILLVTASMIYSTIIMYFSVFTIENPDLEMIEEIKNARNAAIKASNAKSDFLSNMSHELRTPLNAILGFSQGMLEQDLPQSVKDDVEDIVSASDTLLELVNEILDISKIESDKFEIVEVEYAVNKVYKYLVTMTEGRIGSRQLEFIREFDETMPPVLYGDCVRIKQIVVNLLTNSVKYTKEGYVKLQMKYEKIDEESGYLVISVSDSGIGIKEEDIQKLFSKFSRLDLQKNVDVEGTGLGLALTKKLVELMGGEIKVESTYGVGSTFTVKLKQQVVHKTLEEVEGENPMFTRGKFVGNGEKILVVDDNNVNLKVANRLLKNYKLELDNANSGKECIDKVASGHHYDLILLDDQMPVMTGVETVKHLRDIVGFNIPTIALTANAISGVKEKYIEAGFDGYLSKPIDKILLEETLVEFLGEGKDLKNKTESSTEQNTEEAPMEEESIESTPVEEVEPIVPEPETTEVPTVEEEVLEEEPVEELLTEEPETEELLEEEPTPTEELSMEEEQLTPEPEPVVESTPEVAEEEDDVHFDGDPKGSREFLEAYGLDIDKALETLVDMDIYAETAQDVLDESDNKVADLKKFLEAGDMTNYCVVAHALKSDAKYMGMFDLADIAYKHEIASKEGRIDDVKASFDEFMKKTAKMMGVLRKFLGK